MCRNHYDPHLERELAALEEARGGDSSGKPQEEGRAEQVVQSGANYRSRRSHHVLDKLRADSRTTGQSAETSEEDTQQQTDEYHAR